MVGVSPDACHAYVISNQDPKTIYIKTQTMSPYVRCEVKPMLSIDEAANVLKEMQT